jgi:hypothetical protein
VNYQWNWGLLFTQPYAGCHIINSDKVFGTQWQLDARMVLWQYERFDEDAYRGADLSP